MIEDYIARETSTFTKAGFNVRESLRTAVGFQQQALSTTIPRHSCGVSPVALGVQHHGYHPLSTMIRVAVVVLFSMGVARGGSALRYVARQRGAL